MTQGRRIITLIFATAVVLAPFLALLFSLTAGLAVMTAALAATSYVAFDVSREAAPESAQRLRLLAAANAVLALIALGLLIARLSSVL